MRNDQRLTNEASGGGRLDLMRLIPDLFAKYFAFFGPGHRDGIVPARVKELARLKVAAINQCDT
jgi:hypothetical protein